MQTRVVIFGMQVDNDVLHRGIANRPSHAYSSLYLSDFLSFHTLNNEVFRQRFLWTWVIIFGMQVDNDVLYCEIGFSCLFLPVYVRFSFFPYFEWWNVSSKISVKLCKLELSYLLCRLTMMYYIVWLRTSLPMLNLLCICPIFFLSILWIM